MKSNQNLSKLLFLNKLDHESNRAHIKYEQEKEALIKLSDLFSKDLSLLNSIQKHFEALKKSNDYYRSNASEPNYEISVRRKDNNEIEYFILNIFNTNNLLLLLIF